MRRFLVDVDNGGEDVAFAYLLREEVNGSLKKLLDFRRVLSSTFFKRMFISPFSTEISNSSRALYFRIQLSCPKFACLFKNCLPWYSGHVKITLRCMNLNHVC